MKQLEELKARFFADARVVIENKRYSVTLHYREVDDPGAVERQLAHLVERLTPFPQVMTGKTSVNLLPPGSPGKGKASVALMNHLRCTGLFFIGDDETDETVFAMQEGLTLGVRVGHQPHSRARYYIKHQSEVEDVLRFLVHRLDGTPETTRARR